MFWRIPVTTIGKVLGHSAFKKGDLVRDWDELGNWDYYEYNGYDKEDSNWLIGVSQFGKNAYIEASLTDFQIKSDATIPNPYINLENDTTATFKWNNTEKAVAKYSSFNLPESMNRSEAWNFLQKMPRCNQYEAYVAESLKIREKIKSAYTSDDAKILSYTEYTILPKHAKSANNNSRLNWDDLANITGITVVQNYDNLFQLCKLPLLWRKDNMIIKNHRGEAILKIDYIPRTYALTDVLV